jgi:EAL domain-containing protein (putative c-di-GMP-specific phosphodiesterase class I)
MIGDALGLDVVVEGIERESQLDAVRDEVGAPFVQGYMLHRPMPLERILEVVAENRRRDLPPDEKPGTAGELLMPIA